MSYEENFFYRIFTLEYLKFNENVLQIIVKKKLFIENLIIKIFIQPEKGENRKLFECFLNDETATVI